MVHQKKNYSCIACITIDSVIHFNKKYNITKMELHSSENENNYKYGSCKVYIALMIVVFTIFTEITIYFVYYNWSLIKNNVSCIKFNTCKETKIW